jgi:hypothetical protein
MKGKTMALALLLAAGTLQAQTVDQQLLAAQMAYQSADSRLESARRQKQQAEAEQRLAAQRLEQAQQQLAQANLQLQHADSQLLAAESGLQQAQQVLKDAWQQKEASAVIKIIARRSGAGGSNYRCAAPQGAATSSGADAVLGAVGAHRFRCRPAPGCLRGSRAGRAGWQSPPAG